MVKGVVNGILAHVEQVVVHLAHVPLEAETRPGPERDNALHMK